MALCGGQTGDVSGAAQASADDVWCTVRSTERWDGCAAPGLTLRQRRGCRAARELSFELDSFRGSRLGLVTC